jgi:hypothetical protein
MDEQIAYSQVVPYGVIARDKYTSFSVIDGSKYQLVAVNACGNLE